MKVITSTHGNGGRLTHQLIQDVFKKHLPMADLSDNDSCPLPSENLVVTTDAHAIDPIIFPGGDIGKLSVTGTINDLLASGAKPLGLSASFLLHEGLPLETLEAVLFSMGKEMHEHDMLFYSGDTKVVPGNGEMGLYISTTGFGSNIQNPPHPNRLREGMDIICTGPIASHGVCILGLRNGIDLTKNIKSDVASLYPMVKDLFVGDLIECFRDATRGGILTTLYELTQDTPLVAELIENDIPISKEVKAACEILGLQPLEVANEGVALIFCRAESTDSILTHLKQYSTGKDARKIGTLRPNSSRVKVHLKTSIGGTRAVAWTNAENLPRIC
ncbi:MAG: hydrogenase expression/formation protein HypE [Deltaproteobacteria bacterium]|nr:MAG: hydrogenase expression/formation protein HypE [Deltaproteobacteria bacterium]